MDNSILDLHFHTVGSQPGQPRWKGRVMGQLSSDTYLVGVWELDERNKADLPCLKLAKMDQMLSWCFFKDDDGVKDDLAKRAAKHKGAAG